MTDKRDVIPKWLLAEIKAAGYSNRPERPRSKIIYQTTDGTDTRERLLSPHGSLIAGSAGPTLILRPGT